MSEKRFSDWIEVNCAECEHWWTNTCDGVPKGSTKPCNSYLATRNVVIPLQIKSLKKHIILLYIGFIAHMILFILHMIFQIMGWV